LQKSKIASVRIFGETFKTEAIDDLDCHVNVRFAPIVLKKSFSGDERNFLGPLMRFAHGDVRDHIVSAQKRPPTFVSALRSVGAVGTAKNQLSRDFRCRSIFDFFNSIRQKWPFLASRQSHASRA
jgi:hypothetical protein